MKSTGLVIVALAAAIALVATTASATPLLYLLQNPGRQVTAYNAATNVTLVFNNFRYYRPREVEPWNWLNPFTPLDPIESILPQDIEVETSGSPPGIIFRPSVDWSQAISAEALFEYDVYVADVENPLLKPSIVGANLQGIPHASKRIYNFVEGFSEVDVSMDFTLPTIPGPEPTYFLHIYDRYYEWRPEDVETDVSDQEVFSSRYEIRDVATWITLNDSFHYLDPNLPPEEVDTEVSYIQQSFGIYAPAAVLRSGDFNADGHVDARDYTIWRDNLGAVTEANIHGNGDGLNGVSEADFDVWKTYYGTNYPAGGGGVALVTPEPSTMALFVAASIWFALTFMDSSEKKMQLPSPLFKQLPSVGVEFSVG